MEMSQAEVETILEKLTHGTDDDLWEIVYGNGRYSRSQLAVPLKLLSQFHAPDRRSSIVLLDAGYQEPFWILILSLPWRTDGCLRPLMIAHEDGVPRLVGMVLPWNEVIPEFNQQQMTNAQRCAVWWTIKLKELTGSKS